MRLNVLNIQTQVERVRAALNKRIFELEASLQKERFVHSSGASAHEQELEGYKNQIASLTTEVPLTTALYPNCDILLVEFSFYITTYFKLKRFVNLSAINTLTHMIEQATRGALGDLSFCSSRFGSPGHHQIAHRYEGGTRKGGTAATRGT